MRIYKITNLVNDKVYIGKTSKTLDERFKKHCENALGGQTNSPLFYEAIRKHGKKNFKIEGICEAEDEENLNKLERYYIKEYDAQNLEKGYNIHHGGGGVMMNDAMREKISETLKKNQMGESKGGHANKEGEQDRFVKKIMIEFEDEMIDFFSIKGVKKDTDYDEEAPTGTTYILTISMYSYPPEKVFNYSTAEVRDMKYLEFQGKMEELKTWVV